MFTSYSTNPELKKKAQNDQIKKQVNMKKITQRLEEIQSYEHFILETKGLAYKMTWVNKRNHKWEDTLNNSCK